MLICCWRAAAESIAVDMEVYRLTSADQVPPEVLESIRARAKKESEEWSKHVKDGLAIDLAKLKRDPATTKQMLFDGVDVPTTTPKGKPRAKKVKKSP